jgi:hypothetical protein
MSCLPMTLPYYSKKYCMPVARQSWDASSVQDQGQSCLFLCHHPPMRFGVIPDSNRSGTTTASSGSLTSLRSLLNQRLRMWFTSRPTLPTNPGNHMPMWSSTYAGTSWPPRTRASSCTLISPSQFLLTVTSRAAESRRMP